MRYCGPCGGRNLVAATELSGSHDLEERYNVAAERLTQVLKPLTQVVFPSEDESDRLTRVEAQWYGEVVVDVGVADGRCGFERGRASVIIQRSDQEFDFCRAQRLPMNVKHLDLLPGVAETNPAARPVSDERRSVF